MHSAIVVVTQAANFGDFIKGFDPDHLPSATRLADNVWELNFRDHPEALVTLLYHARDLEYRVLPLDEEPRWIVHAAKSVR